LNHISIARQTASSSVVVLLAGDLTMLKILQECFHGTRRIEAFEHNLGIPLDGNPSITASNGSLHIGSLLRLALSAWLKRIFGHSP
jgi:hypothetical protein